MSQQTPDSRQLVSLYKKNGAFDRQRRLLLENFKASETHANLILKLKMLVEGKVKADPTILTKNRGKVGALIQGSIIQEKAEGVNSVLTIVDNDIQEKIIDSPEFHLLLKEELDDFNRKLMGVSDEDWEIIKREKSEKLQQQQQQQQHQETPLSFASSLAAMSVHEDGKDSVSSPSSFTGYKLKPSKVIKAPKINLSRLNY